MSTFRPTPAGETDMHDAETDTFTAALIVMAIAFGPALVWLLG